jgi:sepiapterin reductase
MSTLLMVSGASRGLGRAMSVAFCRSPLLTEANTLEAILLARSPVEDTVTEMKATRSCNLHVHEYSVDLANLSTIENDVDGILERHGTVARSQAILVNCAGTTGFIGRKPSSLEDIQAGIALNFTSKVWLTTRFLEKFQDCCNTTIVNISSMCAIKPTPTMALYCAASAAREIFHATLALDYPNTRILNYAPGSCDTDMQAYLRSHGSLDPSVQAYCKGLVSEGSLVNPQDTANELVRLVLEPGAFKSGERVEYVDMGFYKY